MADDYALGNVHVLREGAVVVVERVDDVERRQVEVCRGGEGEGVGSGAAILPRHGDAGEQTYPIGEVQALMVDWKRHDGSVHAVVAFHALSFRVVG